MDQRLDISAILNLRGEILNGYNTVTNAQLLISLAEEMTGEQMSTEGFFEEDFVIVMENWLERVRAAVALVAAFGDS